MASADGPQRLQEGLEARMDRESHAPEVVFASPPLHFISGPHYLWTPSQSRDQPRRASLIGESSVGHQESDVTNDSHAGERSRICGLKRKSFIVACVVVSIILVIAAVLGSVLPTQLGDRGASSPSNSTVPPDQTQQPLSVQQQSGIAFISASDGAYAYYQDSDSNLVERKLSDHGTWQTSGDGVIAAAAEGSPLAGSALSLGGTEYRVLFFVDDNGQLLSANRTFHSSWSTPISILTTHATQPGTQALDVIQFPDFASDLTVRVYFGSAAQGIRELGIGGDALFDNTEWNGYAKRLVIADSDSQSGIGVTSYNHLARQYVRNQTTGDLLQISFTWGPNNDQRGWWRSTGSSNATDLPVANNSAITACSDETGVGTDYIFYQTTNGSLVSALSLSETSGLSSFQVLETAAPSSKLRALCDDTGAAALYYHGDDNSTLSWLQVRRNGEVVQRGSVNG